jgi:hypothetical protein
MHQSVTMRGRLCDPRHIELAEPIDAVGEEVEVIIRPIRPQSGKSIFEVIAALPPGTRTKEDIDRQIREERDSWGDP